MCKFLRRPRGISGSPVVPYVRFEKGFGLECLEFPKPKPICFPTLRYFREIQKFLQPYRPAASDAGEVAERGPRVLARWTFLGRAVCVAAWKMLYGLGSMLSVQWYTFFFCFTY